MIRPGRSHSGGVLSSAVLVPLTSLLLLGCSSESSGKPTSETSGFEKVNVRDACDHSLDMEAAAALRTITGAPELEIILPTQQSTINAVAAQLRSDLETTEQRDEHILCSLDPIGRVTVGLQIRFQWSPYDQKDTKSTSSTEEHTDFAIANGASSYDNGSYLSFKCSLPSATSAKSRPTEITASASTFGLNAAARAKKREAETRILHSASVRLAGALDCPDSNLPAKLGALKALPLAE